MRLYIEGSKKFVRSLVPLFAEMQDKNFITMHHCFIAPFQADLDDKETVGIIRVTKTGTIIMERKG